jgi:hypothetical protein
VCALQKILTLEQELARATMMAKWRKQFSPKIWSAKLHVDEDNCNHIFLSIMVLTLK